MYAIIEIGGHQYRVAEGDEILVELLEAKEGSELNFDRVLLVGGGESGARIGTPVVEGAAVKARLQETVKGDKLVSYKYKRRKGQHCKKGHRQRYSRVRIEKITA